MLNKEEERRLANCIDILKEERDAFDKLNVEAQLWLATRLKELNDELKEAVQSATELEEFPLALMDQHFGFEPLKIVLPNGEFVTIALWDAHISSWRCVLCGVFNLDMGAAHNHGKVHVYREKIESPYSNPKNEISDRFYPRD